MKAFDVYYHTAIQSSRMMVLATDENLLEHFVSQKDKRFKIGDSHCKIYMKKEVPLSNVMVKDLSVTELLKLIKLVDLGLIL